VLKKKRISSTHSPVLTPHQLHHAPSLGDTRSFYGLRGPIDPDFGTIPCPWSLPPRRDIHPLRRVARRQSTEREPAGWGPITYAFPKRMTRHVKRKTSPPANYDGGFHRGQTRAKNKKRRSHQSVRKSARCTEGPTVCLLSLGHSGLALDAEAMSVFGHTLRSSTAVDIVAAVLRHFTHCHYFPHTADAWPLRRAKVMCS